MIADTCPLRAQGSGRLGSGNDGNGLSVGVSDGGGGGGGGVSVGVSDGGGGGGGEVSVGVSDGGGGGGGEVSVGGGGGWVVWVGPGGGGVVSAVVGAADCDLVGVGVGLGVGLVVKAGPINGILASESFGLALFDGFAEVLALVDLPVACDEERPAVLRADAVDPAVVSDGMGAGDGLSKLNCGSAPPL